ncbi:MAG: glycosyltransferase family 4 protein [Desulfomicrobium sp.]
MKILVLHTHYQQPGGEDQVFAAEVAYLREQGHETNTLTFYNSDMQVMRNWRQVGTTLWNQAAYRLTRATIRKHRPRIVHMHNTFPAASPGVLFAAKAEGVPVVMSLHNYRLLCVNGLFYRDGRPCEMCMGSLPWRGAAHGCYRNRAASKVVAGMLALHRSLGTWNRVDAYIALSEFSRKKFIEGGLPDEKIVLKPNFIINSALSESSETSNQELLNSFFPSRNTFYSLFVGRLSPEKGIQTLLRSFLLLPNNKLILVGDGPLLGEARNFAQQNNMKNISILGRQSRADVLRLVNRATFLVCPSEWYEHFPMTIVEAFASGLPVIASRLGAMAEIVEDGRTGLHFRPGDAQDLANKVAWARAHPEEMAEMGKKARREYETKYTAQRNYQMLMEIYDKAMAHHRKANV